jgi:preprotein translocase subunit SecG
MVIMLTVALTILYTIVCVFLILVVLLQTGKRADLAGAFGGGGSQTAFGARGAATVLAKATTGAAILFMVMAFVLSVIHSRDRSATSNVLDAVEAGSEPAPAAAEEEAPPPTDDLAPLPEEPVPPPDSNEP